MLQVSGEALRHGRLLLFYQCVCHRILRWAGGLALGGILISSPFIGAPWNALVLWGQALFYGAAALGFLASRLGVRAPALYLPYYLFAIHAAGLAGLRAFLLKTDRPYWEPRR
jgi:hypothetical protein